MVQVNFTIDDVTPLISYEPAGAWVEYSDPFPPDQSPFFDQSQVQTSEKGATASFSFFGSAIWLFGTSNYSLGYYNVTLDGATSTFRGGVHDSQAPIFTATGLSLGNHALTLTNWPDETSLKLNETGIIATLDYIVWQTEIGQAAETLLSAVINDTMPAFAYQPPDAWGTNDKNGTTEHMTIADGAYVTFTFSADSVELVGSVGPSMSSYSVQLDSDYPIMYSANRLESHEKVPLFIATNISAGNHTLRVVNVPTSQGTLLSIDYANITWTTISPPLTSAGAVTVAYAHGTSVGNIVEIVVPTTVVLFLIIGLCLFLFRRQRNSVNEFEPIPFSGETAQSGGSSLSMRFAGAFRPMVKSSIPPAILPLSSQLRSGTMQAHAQLLEDRHRDDGNSLVDHELPPPDYRETNSLAP